MGIYCLLGSRWVLVFNPGPSEPGYALSLQTV